jgi:hypothetical protein
MSGTIRFPDALGQIKLKSEGYQMMSDRIMKFAGNIQPFLDPALFCKAALGKDEFCM